MRLLPTLVIATVVFLGVSACGAEVPTVQRPNTIDDVELTDLLANPDKYHRVRVRVKGIARIEFEGNSLYANREMSSSRAWKKGVWLRLGWPVKDDILALDGSDVVVEGTFDASQFGHDGAYIGTIVDISRLAGVP